MPDPLLDLEQRVNKLEYTVGVGNVQAAAEFEAIKKDIALLKEDDKEFVTLDRYLVMERLFWAAVTALIVGLIGGALAILTRGGSG